MFTWWTNTPTPYLLKIPVKIVVSTLPQLWWKYGRPFGVLIWKKKWLRFSHPRKIWFSHSRSLSIFQLARWRKRYLIMIRISRDRRFWLHKRFSYLQWSAFVAPVFWSPKTLVSLSSWTVVGFPSFEVKNQRKTASLNGRVTWKMIWVLCGYRAPFEFISLRVYVSQKLNWKLIFTCGRSIITGV